MAIPWIRLDADAGDAGWTGDLSLQEFGVWVKLLTLVKTSGERGGILRLSKLTPGTLSRRHIPRTTWDRLLGKAQYEGAITVTDDTLTVNGWSRYQPDPTSAQRQRDRRDHPPRDVTDVTDVTGCHGCHDDVTGRDVTGRDVTIHNPPTPLAAIAKKTTKRRKPKTFDELMEKYPGLKAESFQDAWRRWQAVKVEQHKKLTPTMIEGQVRKCGEMGIDRAVAMVNYSTDQGWTGLYEERQDAYGQAVTARTGQRGEAGPGGQAGEAPGAYKFKQATRID